MERRRRRRERNGKRQGAAGLSIVWAMIVKMILFAAALGHMCDDLVANTTREGRYHLVAILAFIRRK
jgi:hypothetical protein